MLSVLREEEVNVVTSFCHLEHQVKELYIRMLSRKYAWHRVLDIKYDDIDVPAAFTVLEISGLITSGMYNFVMNKE
jgi:heme oxygenase